MFSERILFVSLVLALGTSAGCMSSRRLPVYDSGQVGQIIRDEPGEIIGVQEVIIRAPTKTAGTAGVGSRIGSAAAGAAITGNPVAIAVAAGQVLGGVAGAAADDQRGEELTVLTKDGRTVVIVQVRGNVPFAVGDRVRILASTSQDRVVRDESPTRGY